MSFQSSFAAQPKGLILGQMTLAVFLIAVADNVAEWELSLFVVYSLPIFVVGWCVGRGPAFVIAMVAGLAWFLANFYNSPYLTRSGYAWAATNRVFYFTFVAAGTSAMRQRRDMAREQIEALTLVREHELEVVRAVESERVRIGQDLHDGLCQSLAAINCAAACLRAELEEAGPRSLALAGRIQDFLRETMIEARNLARGIMPAQVERDGLISALKDLVDHYNVVRANTAYFESSGEVHVSDLQVALHLYRIAQEALSNAARHAQATQLAVSLCAENAELILSIADDGTGFDPQAKAVEGLGLRTMQYRASLIHGKLTLASDLGRGTTVRCVLPY
jgi:signal transduction histidine kinase